MTVSVPRLYELLLEAFGPQAWWPVDKRYHERMGTDPREEVVIGAILTQNTAWINVEKALGNLKDRQALSFHGIRSLPDTELRRLIQPSGYYNQKAHRLKRVATAFAGGLDPFFTRTTLQARRELLALDGIGPETADSILLYAGGKDAFVVDAYTRRLCVRLPLPVARPDYDQVQRFFEESLMHLESSKRVQMYQEFHALIVQLVKTFCRTTPRCDGCPLRGGCQHALQLLSKGTGRNVRQ